MNEGDIVQIDPKVETFGGCFLVVTEVLDWGVMGYGQNAGQQGQWWLRVKNEDMDITFGRAVWRLE